VRLVLGLATRSATSPEVYCQLLNPSTLAVISTSDVAGCAASDSAEVGPDTWSHAVVHLAASDDTAYALQLYISDYARVISMTAYEVGVVPVDDTVAGAVDPRYSMGSPIWDAAAYDLLANQTALLTSNRRHLLSWSPYDGVHTFTASTGTLTNILDGTSTSVSAATPGFRIRNLYCNTRSRTTVPVVFAAYAVATVNDGQVRLTDGTNTIDITITAGAAGWFVAIGSLPAAASTKYDIHVAAGASGTCRCDGASLLEYE